MRSELSIALFETSLARLRADCAAVGIFREERPLRGGAGVADWRLGGWLSGLLRQQRLGNGGEKWVLIPSRGRLGAPRLLVGDLGDATRFGESTLHRFSSSVARQAVELGCTRVALDATNWGRLIAAESAASCVLAGFREALAGRRIQCALLLAVAEMEAGRWRAAMARAVATQAPGELEQGLYIDFPTMRRPVARPARRRPLEPADRAPTRLGPP